jgi:phosphatidylglycerophosphate synthase
MRKIPPNLENPIDNVLIWLAEPLSILFKKLNFSPNGITTLSLIFGVISVVSLHKGFVETAIITMGLSYFMDCIDGYYARKYKMVTEFGDLYDHVKDVLVFIAYIFVLFRRNKYKLTNFQWLITIGVLIFFLFMSVLYFACQERYYDSDKNTKTLAWMCRFVKDKEKAKKWLSILRYFGIGTFILVVLVFTGWLEARKVLIN